MSETKETTKVTEAELSSEELNALLDIPGAESVLSSEDEKQGFFSHGKVDMTFLTKEQVNKRKAEKPAETTLETKEEIKEPVTTSLEVDTIINETDPDPEKKSEEDISKGRPKVSKDAAVELTKKLIEKKILAPFDDGKAIEDYTLADFEELYEANEKDKEDKLRQEVPVEFFDSLPNQLKYAAKYAADGGTDFKGLFRALAEAEEVRELSADEPKDHETIAKEYLAVTNFGDQEDIDTQVNEWKDLGKLAEKVEKFKPKLDRLREEQVTQRLAKQEQVTRQREEAARQYTNSVYEVLKPSEINGLKLDKKTQGALYNGLVQSQYPSLSGRPTNLLGHLLEKYQVVEPNHALIAEALWLLSDPESYRAKVKEQAKTETTEAIVRKLKTEESKKISSASQEPKEDKPQRTIQRSPNFFKR